MPVSRVMYNLYNNDDLCRHHFIYYMFSTVKNLDHAVILEEKAESGLYQTFLFFNLFS